MGRRRAPRWGLFLRSPNGDRAVIEKESAVFYASFKVADESQRAGTGDPFTCPGVIHHFDVTLLGPDHSAGVFPDKIPGGRNFRPRHGETVGVGVVNRFPSKIEPERRHYPCDDGFVGWDQSLYARNAGPLGVLQPGVDIGRIGLRVGGGDFISGQERQWRSESGDSPCAVQGRRQENAQRHDREC